MVGTARGNGQAWVNRIRFTVRAVRRPSEWDTKTPLYETSIDKGNVQRLLKQVWGDQVGRGVDI
ncbi:MAG TPA: hypothetical protein DD706_20070 [Nitrospiraceae bacterium]|nr:hypothetical protein [Nitrospiraceae bacterium]